MEVVAAYFKVSPRKFPGGTVENHESSLKDSRCPGQVSNRVPTEYKSEVLPLETTSAAILWKETAAAYLNLFGQHENGDIQENHKKCVRTPFILADIGTSTACKGKGKVIPVLN
jgi:hypothetical protein